MSAGPLSQDTVCGSLKRACALQVSLPAEQALARIFRQFSFIADRGNSTEPRLRWGAPDRLGAAAP